MADQKEYNNTNRGAAFPPFEDMGLILQGKLDIDGTEMRVVLVKDVTQNGTKLIGVYEKVGTLFINDKKGNDKAPDYSGPLLNDKQLAGWKKQSEQGTNFLSLNVSDKKGKEQESVNGAENAGFDDEIPF